MRVIYEASAGGASIRLVAVSEDPMVCRLYVMDDSNYLTEFGWIDYERSQGDPFGDGAVVVFGRDAGTEAAVTLEQAGAAARGRRLVEQGKIRACGATWSEVTDEEFAALAEWHDHLQRQRLSRNLAEAAEDPRLGLDE